MKKIFFLLSVLVLGCSTPNSKKDSAPLILVTIPAYEQIAQMIGGDNIVVKSVIPPGANQHLFDPSPRQMAALEGAQVWFGINEPIEKNLLPSFRDQNPNFEYVNLANLVVPIDDGHDRHIWTDPVGMIAQAEVMYKTLLMLLPDKHDSLTEGYEKVKATLQLVNSEIEQKLAPFKGDAILVSHAAFGYFCKRYDLEQLSIEVEGKAPLPRDVERLVAKFPKHKIRCVLVQEQHDEKAARKFATMLDLPVYSVDPAGPHYFQMLRTLAEDIAR